jgi:Fe2+ or Zn2+ uptake regulation protein
MLRVPVNPDDVLVQERRAAGLRVTMPRQAVLTWLAGHPARYERRVGDNHHHLVCRRCARTEDVDCVAGEKPCLEPADRRGFAIDEEEWQ